MSDNEIELYRQHGHGREKQVYFLLAAAGASIAFALSQTKGAPLLWSQLPLAAAALCWAASFVAGCKSLQCAQRALDLNLDLIQVQKGTHRLLEHPAQGAALVPLVREKLEIASSRVGRWSWLQFTALICGAGFYVLWHVIEMYLRR